MTINKVLYLEEWPSAPVVPRELTRIWVLWELYNSATMDVTFEVAMTRREHGTAKRYVPHVCFLGIVQCSRFCGTLDHNHPGRCIQYYIVVFNAQM